MRKDHVRPTYRVEWEDATKNSANVSKHPRELAADRRMIIVTSVGYLTVKDDRFVVLSQQADHPIDPDDEWTYRDHIKIPRGMVRRMARLR